jgi:5-methylcytosine-specific restriction endonuclease McrA
MDAATRRAVRDRGNGFCEYCRIHEVTSVLSHHVEHIRAKQHGGSDDLQNLAMACHHCNELKGPNLAGIDPNSNEITPLFNPRLDAWDEHFEIKEGCVIGRTSVGRTTVHLLKTNEPNRVELRMAS